MRRVIVIFALLFSSHVVSAQSFISVEGGMMSCWKVLDLKDSLHVILIDYFPNTILCGKVPAASVAIVELPDGDTIRVLEFCMPDRNFKRGDKLILHPLETIKQKGMVMLPNTVAAIDCRYQPVTKGVLRMEEEKEKEKEKEWAASLGGTDSHLIRSLYYLMYFFASLREMYFIRRT